MDKMRIEITVDGLTYGEVEKIDPSIDLEETAKSMAKKLTKNILKTRQKKAKKTWFMFPRYQRQR